MTLQNPQTGEVAVLLRVWFTQSGSSPDKPFTQRRWMEERYMALPAKALEAQRDRWSIESEFGSTCEP